MDAQPDAADGHARSGSRGRNRTCSARTSTPATSASTSSAFPARTIRASATSAYAGLSRVPVRRHDLGLLQPARQPRRLEPDLPRRAHLLDRHQRHQGQGPARFPRRLLPELPVPRSLAAGNRQPARAVRLQLPNTTGLRGGQTATSTTPTRRSCSGRSGRPTRACRTS